MRRVLVIFLVFTFLIPQNGILLGPLDRPILSSPSESQAEEIESYNAMRVQEQVLNYMALNWTDSAMDALYESEENDEFSPIERERIVHTVDYNETVEPIVLFDKYANASIEDSREASDISFESPIVASPLPTPLSPALPMSPAKSGHWFRKKSYSVLAFEWDYPEYLLHVGLWLDIERDQDQYSRYLTVYFDGNIIYHAVIGSSGFHSSILISYIPAGTHKVEVEIHYCGWKKNQWKMTYIWPWIVIPNFPDEPILDFWEYFPGGHADDTNPKLDYQVRAGKYTYFDIFVEDEGGSPSKQIEIRRKSSISSQWYYWTTIYSGTPYRLYMGYFSPPKDYYVRLKLLESPASYYTKKLTYNCVNYREVRLEVDYMTDASDNPLMSFNDMNNMLEYVKTYYILHGYQRPDYYIDDAIPSEESYSPLTIPEWKTLHHAYYYHEDSSDHQWVLIGNAYDWQDNNGWYSAGGAYYEYDGYEWGCAVFTHGLFIWSSDPPFGYGYGDYIDGARCSLLHEFGHFAGIIVYDWFGNELACSNVACCMSTPSTESVIPEPWYCGNHWSLRKERWKP